MVSIPLNRLHILYLACLCNLLLLTYNYLYKLIPYYQSLNGADDLKQLSKLGTGDIGWDKVDGRVYQPHGYSMVNSTDPLPVVHRWKNQTCNEIFEQWFSVNSVKPSWTKPPCDIPISERSHFLMNNHAILNHWLVEMRVQDVLKLLDKAYARCHNDVESKPVVWEKDEIDRLVKSSGFENQYFRDGEAVYIATKKYSIRNRTGLVIGSQRPWVESACIRNGVKKVVTVDYQAIKCDHPMFNFIHAMVLAKNWKKYADTFDFAVSFSSIEHSGMGRYGDPLDAIGDLREMQKLRCLLKKDGLLFLGIPVGLDMIVFNAHRIYGKIRLPMMLEGYELIDVYRGQRSVSVDELPFDQASVKGDSQFLFVLRRLDDS